MRENTGFSARGALAGLVRAGGRFVDTLLPAGCAICSAAVPGDRPPVCGLCASRVQPVPLPRCPRCGLTRLLDVGLPGECPECEAWPPHIRTASACLHDGVAAELVRGLKYRGHTALTSFLGERMVEPAGRLVDGSSPWLVPVPLAPSRRRERGFNQAELLASSLGSLTGWPTARLLRRPSGGPSLARRSRHDRKRLARTAYAVERAAVDLTCDFSPTVLLVDDVITTGATVNACAEALDQAGVRCLGAVSFARTAAALKHS